MSRTATPVEVNPGTTEIEASREDFRAMRTQSDEIRSPQVFITDNGPGGSLQTSASRQKSRKRPLPSGSSRFFRLFRVFGRRPVLGSRGVLRKDLEPELGGPWVKNRRGRPSVGVCGCNLPLLRTACHTLVVASWCLSQKPSVEQGAVSPQTPRACHTVFCFCCWSQVLQGLADCFGGPSCKPTWCRKLGLAHAECQSKVSIRNAVEQIVSEAEKT